MPIIFTLLTQKKLVCGIIQTYVWFNCYIFFQAVERDKGKKGKISKKRKSKKGKKGAKKKGKKKDKDLTPDRTTEVRVSN